MNQPIGQDIHIPVTSKNLDNTRDRITLSRRSAKVPIINSFIAPPPFKKPSQQSFAATIQKAGDTIRRNVVPIKRASLLSSAEESRNSPAN